MTNTFWRRRKGSKRFTKHKVYTQANSEDGIYDDKGGWYSQRLLSNKTLWTQVVDEAGSALFTGEEDMSKDDTYKYNTDAVISHVSYVTLNGHNLNKFTKLDILRMIEDQADLAERALHVSTQFPGISDYGTKTIVEKASQKAVSLAKLLDKLTIEEETA